MGLIILQELKQGYITAFDLPQGWTRADTIAVSALVLSILTIFFSYYSIYLSKRLEINFLKFDKLGIDTINKLYESLDEIFDKKNIDVAAYLTTITENIVDVEVFLTKFNDLFDRLELQRITEINERFTDRLYEDSTKQIKDLRTEYLAYKSRVIFELYEYALNDNTSIRSGIIKSYYYVCRTFKRFWNWLLSF